MGIAERKEREKQEMRDRIIEVATRMFIEDGYEKTSIRNIAEQIEYSPATIYLYFKDKDELFYAIHDKGFEKLLHQMEPLHAIKNPLERLRELGRTYIQFALNNPEYYDLMFIMRAPMNALKDEQCWQYGETTFNTLTATVKECVDQQLIKKQDAQLAAMYTWASVHGLVSLHIRERYKVMDMDDTQLNQLLFLSLDQIVENMKA